MSVRRLLTAFEEWRAAGTPLVLGTVYETLGSTYSKAGHRILVAANGDYQGLVSGGCLEGDLAERARRSIAAHEPAAVTYDLRDEADELWGLGVGCNGLIRVFLQPLAAADGYQPFASIAECLMGRAGGAVATIVESQSSGAALGAALIAAPGRQLGFGLTAALAGELRERCASVAGEGAASLERHAGGFTVLYAPLVPIPRLLVLGAGLDAVPLVGMAAELGWRVTVADHRPAYVARQGFERAEQRVLVDPAALAATLMVEDYDAIIVMSHHLATDRKYLAQLADAPARYLGVLGPRARRDRLLAELPDHGLLLEARLRGPVGLDIGADSPESIALSILAELQTALGKSAGETRRIG